MHPLNNYRDSIHRLLQGKLPGALAHRTMLPPEREIELPVDSFHKAIPSGVLLLLFPTENQLSIALIKRAAHMKYHPGQIGFPGGKLEPSESSPLEAAIRETFEEIGVNRHHFEVLGRLSPLFLSVTNYLIYPYIAWCEHSPAFNINYDEADKLIVVPLNQLNSNNISYQTLSTYSGPLTVPGYAVSGEFIWGATAMILAEFIWITKGLFGDKIGIMPEM